MAVGDRELLRRDGDEVRTAVGRQEAPAVAEAFPTPLDLVAALGEVLDAVVEADDARDLVADLLRRRERDHARVLRIDAAREVDEDLPLRARFADARAWDLGAEEDAPLGR